MTEKEIQEEMLIGPPVIFMVCADFSDGTHVFYAFDTEEAQVDWVNQLASNCREMNVEKIRYNQNLLNYTERDEWLMIIH